MQKDKYGNYSITVGSNQVAIPTSAVQSMLSKISNGEVTPQDGAKQLAEQYGGANMGTRPDLISGIQPLLIPQGNVTVGGRVGYYSPQGNFIASTTQNKNTTVNGSGATTTTSQTGDSTMPDGIYNVGGAFFQKQGGNVSYVSDPGTLRGLQSGTIQAKTGVAYGDLLSAHQPDPSSGASSPIMSGLPSTGNSKLDSILGGLSDYVSGQLTQGFSVNPNLQITPDLVSKFLSDAHSTIDPYYQQQLTGEITNINASLDSLGKQYQNDQADSQAQFQQGIANEREAAGGSGTAFSGGRGLNESNMLAAQNRTLGALDTNYGQQIGAIARAGGAVLGAGIPGLTGSASSFNLPTLSTQTASLEGPRGGSVTGGALDTSYDPSIYKYGTAPSNYASDVTGQSNQYLSSYLTSAGNNSARSFQNVNGVPTLM